MGNILSVVAIYLPKLIETNIRQRGIGNPNPVKLGRCIKELERIYGIENGGKGSNQYVQLPKVSEATTQSDLADMIGISVDTLNNYKLLADIDSMSSKNGCYETDMIPELEELLDTGIVILYIVETHFLFLTQYLC